MAENEPQAMTVPGVTHIPATEPPEAAVVQPPPPAPEPAPRRDVMTRLATPAVALVAGGLLLLGVGFGAGLLVGHDRGGSSRDSFGPGGMHSGQEGFGQAQRGEGQFPRGGPNFGGRPNLPNQNQQGQPGLNQQTPTQ